MALSLADRVARRVLMESLHVQARENVTIETWDTGLAFAQRTSVQARRLGATPVLLLEHEDAFVEGLRASPKGSSGRMGEHEHALLSKTDAYVFLPGPLLGGSPRLSPGEVTAATAYNSSWYGAAKKARLRGARMLFGYVGPELAEILRKPVRQIIEHQWTAAMVDLRRVRRTGLALSRRMRARAKVALMSGGEILRFELGSEEALEDGIVGNDDLTRGGNMTNVPPGYYARGIVPSSLDGTVRLFAPVPRLGAIADLKLEFSKGRLRHWQSDGDQRWLNRLVRDTAKERRTLGAVAVGLNPALRNGFGQDRLVEGAVGFFGLFQSTVRSATLDVDGTTLIRDGRLVSGFPGPS